MAPYNVSAYSTHNPPAPMNEQFQKTLDNCRVTPRCDGGKEYIRTKPLIQWMGATQPGQSASNAEILLYMVYGPTILPISAIRVCGKGDDPCAVVFSILLEIGLGHIIHKVAQEDIVDQSIPMSLADLKEHFQNIDKSEGVAYAKRFNEAQWKYRPLTFRWDVYKECPEQRIIPICRKQEIGRGGQARVYQIAVQADYVAERLQQNLPNDDSFFMDDEFGPCYQFALKTFEEANIAYFNDEKAAFDALKSNKGMIRYLASYGHRETRKVEKNNGESTDKTVTTKHILLEYGRFDLMKIFMYRLSPVISDEIETFWTSLIQIADALKGIHKIKTKNGDFAGWHNDIKPGNIIVVDGEYKLADPGFAKFQKSLETDRDAAPKILQDGMTQSYAAPECFASVPSARPEVTQSVDIWSVGCVLSMAATWVVLGFQGVYQFKIVRQKAVENFRNSAQHSSERTIEPGDFFHNGVDLLPEVKQWHQYVRSAARHTDYITRDILDFVEKNLLVPKNRMPAEKLYKGLQDVLLNCHKEFIPHDLEQLMETLGAIDEEAPSTPSGAHATQATPYSVRRKEKKPKMDNLEVPDLLKTAARFESVTKMTARRSPRLVPQDPPPPRVSGAGGFSNPSMVAPQPHPGQYPAFTNGYHQPMLNQPPAIALTQAPGQGPVPQQLLQRTSTFRTQRAQDFNSPEPQSVIQAREEFRDSRWFTKPTDAVLKAHFDKRDIVFLVDNSSSMAPYWEEATYVLETLVMKASPFDKNGMDLFFTLGPSENNLLNEKSESAFRKKMLLSRPHKRHHKLVTDMVRPIESIFDKYFNDIDERKRKGKKPKEQLTLIILTDGMWEGMSSSDEVYKYVQTLLKKLEKRDILGYKKRPVSIEFVQFGDDDNATERLRALDDDMEFKGHKDIIDHEQFSITGDVRKMLLGSFVPMMDKLNHHPESPPPMHSDTFGSIASSAAVGSTRNNRMSMPAGAAYGSHAHFGQHLGAIHELDSPTTARGDRSLTGSTGSSGSVGVGAGAQEKGSRLSFWR
ncbi:hypothetical protein EJ04DRAFT_173330 [Polyplosphaeria fusca]|uniref:Protein kinase domain-containing protein n=1 Tax=Polyplosphaeria fusca TaxID=682080 RepID=A0A9P4USG2_9PLEO|nr:hypothetical protein EJ04DRAFT_173330 [Polyplosphaeria fusca]